MKTGLISADRLRALESSHFNDLLSRFPLPALPPPPTIELVLIVHGTYANPPRGFQTRIQEPFWWQGGGGFVTALDAALERHGSIARCSLPFLMSDKPLLWSGWSGENSEAERRRAAYDLAECIRSLGDDRRIRRVHIVAHSHGGNVTRRAMRYLGAHRHFVSSIIYLGTPFLHFDDAANWRQWAAKTNWPMLAVALIAFAITPVVSSQSDIGWLSGFFAAATGIAAGAAVWRYAKSTERNAEERPATAINFRNDEAINVLRTCADIESSPHRSLTDLFGTAAPFEMLSAGHRPEGLLDRIEELWRLVRNAYRTFSNHWNGSVRIHAENVTSAAFRLPLLGSVCSLLLIMAFRPYRPALRPYFLSRMPGLDAMFLKPLTDTFFANEEGKARRTSDPWRGDDATKTNLLKHTFFDPGTWHTMAAGTCGIGLLILYPIDLLLGLPSWLAAVGTRFAILIGLRAAAGSAAGNDMVGAAFQSARTGIPPEGIHMELVPPAIEAQVEQALDQRCRVDFARLRTAIGPERGRSLLGALHAALSDVDLMHAQYYQDPSVIDFVAQIIARKSKPVWAIADQGAPAKSTEDPLPVRQ